MAEIDFYCDIDINGNRVKNATYDDSSIPNAALSTNPLARANHTGSQTASTISDLASVVQAYRLDQFAAPTNPVSLNSQRITNLAAPSAGSDAVTKTYVDNLVNGMDWKASVRCRTTANITLSGEQTIDGVAAVTGDRVLVANQSTGSQNGIYVVAAGSWARADDMASGAAAGGDAVFVNEGTTYANTQWTCTNNDGSDVVGTDALTFAQVGSGTSYTADESSLHLDGTQFSIKSDWVGQTSITTLGTITTGTWQGTDVGVAHGGTGASDAAGARSNLSAAGAYSATITGDGSTTAFAVTHSLGTKDVIVSIRRASDDAIVMTQVVATSTSQVTVTFSTAPANAVEYRVIIAVKG